MNKRQPKCTNLMFNIARLSQKVIVKKVQKALSELKVLMPPEQKYIVWIKDTVHKFTKVKNMVLDTYAAKCYDTEACIFLLKH